MRVSTSLIIAAYGVNVLAADSTDYLGGLTDYYGSHATDIAEQFGTGNTYFQQYESIVEDLTDRPWYSDLAQLSDAKYSEITKKPWFTSYVDWASSVGRIGAGFPDFVPASAAMNGPFASGSSMTESGSGGGAGGMSGSMSSGSDSMSSGFGSKTSGSGGSGKLGSSSKSGSERKSSGSGGKSESSSKSSGSSSESSGSSSGSDSSSTAGSGAHVYYVPFGATLGALILALM